MTLFASIVIIIVTAAFVAQPFFTAAATDSTPVTPRVPGERQLLERQKLEAYAAIKEAEFDQQMGKLSDTDFALVRDKYAAQALAAIAALDAPAPTSPRQIREARRPTRIAFCPICGRGVPPRANFCPACGQSLCEAVA